MIGSAFISSTPSSLRPVLRRPRTHLCRTGCPRTLIHATTSVPPSSPPSNHSSSSSQNRLSDSSMQIPQWSLNSASTPVRSLSKRKITNSDGDSSSAVQKQSTSTNGTSSPPTSPTSPPPPPLWPRLLALFVAAVFGTNFPVVKFLQSGSDPLPASIAAVARFSLAAAALMPASVLELRNRPPKNIKYMLTSALIGVPVFLGYYSQALSLDGTDAGKSAFLCSLAVVIVPLIQRVYNFISHSQPTSPESSKSSLLTTWGAPFLAVCGVALLELSDASPPTIADAWGLAQAFAFGTGFIMNEYVANEYPGYSLSTSALQLATISTCSLVWAFCDSSFSFPHLTDAFSTVENSVGLLYAGLISTAMTIVLSNIALAKVTAGELTVLLTTEPVWAAAFSAATLGERMGSGAILGAIIILLACLVNQADFLPSLVPNLIGQDSPGDFDSKEKPKSNSGLKKICAAVGTPIASFSALVSSIQDFVNKTPPPPS